MGGNVILENEENRVTSYKLTSISNETEFTVTCNIIVAIFIASSSSLKEFLFSSRSGIQLADHQRTLVLFLDHSGRRDEELGESYLILSRFRS